MFAFLLSGVGVGWQNWSEMFWEEGRGRLGKREKVCVERGGGGGRRHLLEKRRKRERDTEREEREREKERETDRERKICYPTRERIYEYK